MLTPTAKQLDQGSQFLNGPLEGLALGTEINKFTGKSVRTLTSNF